MQAGQSGHLQHTCSGPGKEGTSLSFSSSDSGFSGSSSVSSSWLSMSATDSSSPTMCRASIALCKPPAALCDCVCASNISADQDQTDLRFSIWLLLGLRLCNVRFVWTTVILLINCFLNALPLLLALSTIVTIVTIVTCAPEPITAHHSHVRNRADHCRAHPRDIP